MPWKPGGWRQMVKTGELSQCPACGKRCRTTWTHRLAHPDGSPDGNCWQRLLMELPVREADER
jgi:hypothetical protein